jgi:hypothetical protein
MIPHEFFTGSRSLPAPFTVPGGQEWGFAIPACRRGTIEKLRVVQLSGTQDGFSYTLYNSIAGCPPGVNPSAASVANGYNELLFRVTPTLVVPAGQAQFSSSEGFPEDGVSNLNLPYANVDSGAPALGIAAALLGGASNTDRLLYLKIHDAGSAGAKTYGIAMTILDPMIST